MFAVTFSVFSEYWYTIADGDDIVIDYLEQTERWTSYDYWLTA
ncbi:MAG: hypothetical protein ACLU3I_20400 [Acutalibacteraceae bacterium]